ncbi:hypothetical protein NA655_00645 [Pseudomonas kuykendallii]|uniref:Uncharacterized protein n=1 Tax=Pseudomonas kuykendallii TaxID=1007099 RepID=A0A1H3CID7_9PSED|nr:MULTISPECIES: hypothetical protein [Pseudomonas]MCQ4269527.1 hypothetical protein [Pseudomonas kuykendallii]SDX53239.1 hypothetical protein SAMN05216287_3244 [Pseudomonas kuykendallii]
MNLQRSLLAALLTVSCGLATASPPPAMGNGAMAPPAENPAPDSPARLIVSRDEEGLNACTVDLYVQSQMAAQIPPGEQVVLEVAAGDIALSVAQAGSALCKPDQAQVSVQSVLLQPGETRGYKVMQNASGFFLSPQIE